MANTRRSGAYLWAGLLLAGFAVPAAAVSAECPQHAAVYTDRDKAYEVRFMPVTSEAAATSHLFKVAVLKTDVVFDGVVLPTEGVERSNALVMNNCPEGDATGQELEACIIWEGVVYSVGAAGAIGNLPNGAEPASEKVLLADFGRSLRYSAFWETGQASVAPWDVFAYAGCRP